MLCQRGCVGVVVADGLDGMVVEVFAGWGLLCAGRIDLGRHFFPSVRNC
jgi:hypothetical protein